MISGNNGDDSNNTGDNVSAVFIFRLSGGVWAQEACVKASNAQDHDHFGFSVALNADGKILVSGAANEDGSGTGIGANPADNGADDAGAVYVY